MSPISAGARRAEPVHRSVRPIAGVSPAVAPSAFVAPSAAVVGRVEVGDHASVWYGSVLRGDTGPISIGANANVQDGSVVSATDARPSVIGNNVTIGHGCVLHACNIGDDSIIGMGSVVLEGAQVEAGAMLAAGTVLSKGSVVRTGELWGGNPGRRLRDLEPSEIDGLRASGAHYVNVAAAHRDEWTGAEQAQHS